MKIKVGPKNLASLLCFSWGDQEAILGKPCYSLHFFVKPSFWLWGRKHTKIGAGLASYGLGPLFKLGILY